MIRRLILVMLTLAAAPASAQTFNAATVGPAITPTITQAGVSLVAKASAGSLFGVLAVNTSATAGFLVVINAAAVPAAAAAIAPQECVPLAANSSAAVSYGSGPADAYGTGIVVLLSTSCATYTAGPTGFIKARVQ